MCLGCDASTRQDDIIELRRQVKIQFHQVDQMKEELAFREGLVALANIDQVNAEREMVGLKVCQP